MLNATIIDVNFEKPAYNSGMQDIGGRAWAKYMHVQDMQGAVAFT